MERMELIDHASDVRLVNSIVIAVIFFGLGIFTMLSIDMDVVRDQQAEIQALKAKCRDARPVYPPVAVK